MYISEISIEGFKSYAQRVTLTNFDSTFNAITGLNGSGKSNVLDSICFVLGIKNLSQVRATNLQELVYKQGQAGITKATVSITWRNDDPKTGPAGYEDKEYITITRQVVIGGRNKYLINGHLAQENRVQDLFHSVQLNVNNPHFLIMQGRITKVLNMKPMEILSLLEEAAGTRMYEKKREAAVRTLEKKQQRLEQIDTVLGEDILPSLEQLRHQCSTYQEWAELRSLSERLKRLCIAYDHVKISESIDAFTGEVQEMANALQAKQGDRQRVVADAEEVAAQVRVLQTEKELQAQGEISELQQQADALQMRLTKEQAACSNKSETLAAEHREQAKVAAALKELQEQDMAAKVQKAEQRREEARAQCEEAERAVEAAARELAGAEAGDGRDESNRSLKERLADAQNAQTAAVAEAKGCEVRAKHLEKQLAETRKALQLKHREGSDLSRELEASKQAVADCERKLQELSSVASRAEQLRAAQEGAGIELRRLRDEAERLSREVAGCDFHYQIPRANFDQSKVHGVLARLVRVKDPAASTALEVAAGGKLYQVVVEDEVVAKDILEHGRLGKRVTIIPLNKIQYSTIPAGTLDAARRLVHDAATPALELVGCSEAVEAAVKYAFGPTFICKDANTAKKLAFSREVSHRCITLEGDDFNPSGLLTGGSRAVQQSVLSRLHELAAVEGALAQHQRTYREAEEGLHQVSAGAKQYQRLTHELDLARHKLALLQERIAGGEASQLMQEVEALSAQLDGARGSARAAIERRAQLEQDAKALEREISTFGSELEGRIKAAQAKLNKAKAKLDACRKALRKADAELQEARAEQEAAVSEAASLQARLDKLKKSVAELEADVARLQAAVASTQADFSAASTKLSGCKARLAQCDEEIGALEKRKDRLMRQAQDLELEGKRLETKSKMRADELRTRQDHLAHVERSFPWVAHEKASFGRGDYDFKEHDMKKVQAEMKRAEGRLEELKGKVDPKAAAKLEKAEAEFRNLQEKRSIVEKDRIRIQQVISELDIKKRDAMADTWRKVNTDFGSIFSTLLPGTEAKLEPPEGQTFEAGLEVRVAFGKVWKESLTELSGGQRSLLALSLILALCRFKPAPLYILDEVDAALDLNHTQNIGRMIKQHFPQSQFLIVSLKEGMFNNASVLFRTKFIDGVSTITRHALAT